MDHVHDHHHGATYDLRFSDAMVQHRNGAPRVREFFVVIGEPGVGALARSIWRDQAQEIRAMGQWHKAWYPRLPWIRWPWPRAGTRTALRASQG